MAAVRNVISSILVIYATSSLALDSSPEVEAFVDDLVAEHHFNPDVVRQVLADAEIKQDVIDLMTRPAERTMNWERYRKIFITEKRVREGVEFAAKHTATLARAEQEFGVPGNVIVAIIGVETSYGRIKGSHTVVDALATLGFAYPPRASFFRSQLKHFLVLTCEEGIAPFDSVDACALSPQEPRQTPVSSLRELEGSYAGAMGIGQFIPSSYRDFAIDFDGDQFRDIWNNEVDAIGSVANYFKIHKWKNQLPVLLDVEVDETNAKVASLANQSLDLKRTVSEWQDLGVRVSIDDPSLKAALFRFETSDGDFYRLAFHDFYVITRYNRSRLYAAVVWELAQLIREGTSTGG